MNMYLQKLQMKVVQEVEKDLNIRFHKIKQLILLNIKNILPLFHRLITLNVLDYMQMQI